MTSSGPEDQGPDRRLLTHKNYAIEMVGSIIRDKDIDPCANQGTFFLARVRFSFCLHLYYLLI